jgi:hypothetical protein
LDLQDHDEPSAQDHTKQPEHPNPLGSGRPAPHQELSIRHAEQDLQSEIKGGRDRDEYRIDKETHGNLDDEDDDEDGKEYGHEDGDLADGESDDLMDDDLMDKISSSPSIDDGMDSRSKTASRKSADLTQRTLISSSFMRFIISLLPSTGRQTRRRATPWFFLTTVIATGGWFVW